MIDKRIITLITLAKTKSFTKTAELLNLTQPAISTQIKTLEEQYHIKIFNREKNDLKLTKEGEILLKYANKFNEIEKQIIPELLLLNENKVIYNIGICESLKEHIIPLMLANYSIIHQNVSFKLSIHSINELYSKLRSYELDLAIIDVSNHELRYKTHQLNADNLVFGINKNNPLSQKDTIRLTDVRKQNIILPSINSKTYQLFSSYVKDKGLKLDNFNIIMINDDIDQCKTLVKHNLGIALFMESFILLDEDIKSVYLHELTYSRNISFIFDREYHHEQLVTELSKLYFKIIAKKEVTLL